MEFYIIISSYKLRDTGLQSEQHRILLFQNVNNMEKSNKNFSVVPVVIRYLRLCTKRCEHYGIIIHDLILYK